MSNPSPYGTRPAHSAAQSLPYKKFQCRYFDRNTGNCIKFGCTNGSHCRFVHPSDPNWPGLPPSLPMDKRKNQSRYNNDGGGCNKTSDLVPYESSSRGRAHSFMSPQSCSPRHVHRGPSLYDRFSSKERHGHGRSLSRERHESLSRGRLIETPTRDPRQRALSTSRDVFRRPLLPQNELFSSLGNQSTRGGAKDADDAKRVIDNSLSNNISHDSPSPDNASFIGPRPLTIDKEVNNNNNPFRSSSSIAIRPRADDAYSNVELEYGVEVTTELGRHNNGGRSYSRTTSMRNNEDSERREKDGQRRGKDEEKTLRERDGSRHRDRERYRARDDSRRDDRENSRRKDAERRRSEQEGKLAMLFRKLAEHAHASTVAHDTRLHAERQLVSCSQVADRLAKVSPVLSQKINATLHTTENERDAAAATVVAQEDAICDVWTEVWTCVLDDVQNMCKHLEHDMARRVDQEVNKRVEQEVGRRVEQELQRNMGRQIELEVAREVARRVDQEINRRVEQEVRDQLLAQWKNQQQKYQPQPQQYNKRPVNDVEGPTSYKIGQEHGGHAVGSLDFANRESGRRSDPGSAGNLRGHGGVHGLLDRHSGQDIAKRVGDNTIANSLACVHDHTTETSHNIDDRERKRRRFEEAPFFSPTLPPRPIYLPANTVDSSIVVTPPDASTSDSMSSNVARDSFIADGATFSHGFPAAAPSLPGPKVPMAPREPAHSTQVVKAEEAVPNYPAARSLPSGTGAARTSAGSGGILNLDFSSIDLEQIRRELMRQQEAMCALQRKDQ